MSDLVLEIALSDHETVFSGALGKAPKNVTEPLPEPEPMGATAASEEEPEEDLEEMQSRLAALRS